MIRQLEFLALLTACYLDSKAIVAETCSKIELQNGKVEIRGMFLIFTCDENFEMIGVNVARCEAGICSSNPPICVTFTCAMPEVTDDLNVRTLYKGGALSVTCGPGLTRIGAQIMYCLNGTWSSALPTCSSSLKLECDFEQDDLCGWNQDRHDNFDWLWHQGKTPTPGTGPQVDQTLKSPSGHYLFIESSSPQKSGDRARLLSPVYTEGSVDGMCLEFFYHMFDNNKSGIVGDLDVFVQPVNSISILVTVQHIFHQSGNQGSNWIKADAYIPKQSTTFQVVIQATIQNSWFSDIAIDDIRIYNCSSNQYVMTGTVASTNIITEQPHHERSSEQASSISLTTDTTQFLEVKNDILAKFSESTDESTGIDNSATDQPRAYTQDNKSIVTSSFHSPVRIPPVALKQDIEPSFVPLHSEAVFQKQTQIALPTEAATTMLTKIGFNSLSNSKENTLKTNNLQMRKEHNTGKDDNNNEIMKTNITDENNGNLIQIRQKISLSLIFSVIGLLALISILWLLARHHLNSSRNMMYCRQHEKCKREIENITNINA